MVLLLGQNFKYVKMKISSDLGNRHPVTIDQLVMPAVELLEG
jgi:hypothetical protein